jgi:hypothetical protein
LLHGFTASSHQYRNPIPALYENCASNKADRAPHIWDQHSKDGGMEAMATIVVPWLVDRFDGGTTWQAMARWIHDHLPYSTLQFLPKLSAFTISWRERPRRRVASFVVPRGVLTKPGMPNHEGNHCDQYPDFPAGVPIVGHGNARTENGHSPTVCPSKGD